MARPCPRRGQFGVVVSAQMRLHAAQPTYFAGTYDVQPASKERLAELLKIYVHFMDGLTVRWHSCDGLLPPGWRLLAPAPDHDYTQRNVLFLTNTNPILNKVILPISITAATTQIVSETKSTCYVSERQSYVKSINNFWTIVVVLVAIIISDYWE